MFYRCLTHLFCAGRWTGRKIPEGLTAQSSPTQVPCVLVSVCVCAASFTSKVRLKVQRLCNLEFALHRRSLKVHVSCVWVRFVTKTTKFFVNELVPPHSLPGLQAARGWMLRLHATSAPPQWAGLAAADTWQPMTTEYLCEFDLCVTALSFFSDWCSVFVHLVRAHACLGGPFAVYRV